MKIMPVFLVSPVPGSISLGGHSPLCIEADDADDAVRVVSEWVSALNYKQELERYVKARQLGGALPLPQRQPWTVTAQPSQEPARITWFDLSATTREIEQAILDLE
jgi:hypothetical protein